MLQAQKEPEESEIRDENADTVVFRAKGQANKRRQALVAFVTAIFKPLMITAAVVELLLLLLALLSHAPQILHVFLLTAPLLAVCGVLMKWCAKKLSGPVGNPVMTLSPEGLTLQTEPFLGTIPWDEIASVEPGRTLGVSVVVIMPKNKAALLARLGNGGRFLWMYAMPGDGLGFPCTPFGMLPADLAARINRYRERGL